MSPRTLAGLFAIALLVTAPAVGQDRGVLTLVDRRLTPGATAGLTGGQFVAGSQLVLALEGAGRRVSLGSITVDPAGLFSDSLRLPDNLAPGAWRLVARSAGGDVIAGLDIAILATAAPSADGRSAAAAERPAPAAQLGSTAPAEGGRTWTVLGYDWPRLHAALNDFPAALLLIAVVFEIAGLLTRRPSLRAAGFWTLLAGLAGTIAAVVAGLLAEGIVEHDDVAHLVMERHKTFALITLGLFAALGIWRVARRNAENRREQAAWAVVAAGGVALLIVTAQLGGSLTFDHAMGLPSATLHDVLERRGEEMMMPMAMPGDSATSDSTAPPGGRPHRDAPGARPHSHSPSKR